jgi:hypothetical protein
MRFIKQGGLKLDHIKHRAPANWFSEADLKKADIFIHPLTEADHEAYKHSNLAIVLKPKQGE